MTQKFAQENAQVLRFGGGQNSRASEDRIDPLECTEGQNFILDPGNGEFRPRNAFDLVGTVPNGAEIRGFATHLATDGTVTMLVQAGATVYQWDGVATFTPVGTVNASAKLRGPKEANWPLDNKVIITDLNLAEEVQEWNGTTFQQTAFLASDGVTGFGTFRAKYCVVENERAFFGNVYDNGSAYPHLLVCSKRGVFEQIVFGGFAAAERPSSSLSEEAPWFLPVPQFKPINGMVFAIGLLAISQEKGAFEKLTGSNAKDFALDKLHDGSGAAGSESVVSTSNDILYGRPGAIESLLSTDKFGDVEYDDLSFKIRPDIEDFTGWTLVFNPRLHRLYCFPEDQQECWVCFTDFIGSDLSPWSKWVTKHPLSFEPTAVMLCRDPADGLEYVFMGDSSGNLFRLEGSGTLGDAGSYSIEASRTSVLYQGTLDSVITGLNGWLQHRKGEGATVNLDTLWSGESVTDIQKQVELAALAYDTPYGGEVYYGGDYYYGVPQENRLIRRKWGVAGRSSQFQLRTTVDGFGPFAVTEIGFRYEEKA